MRSTSAGGGTSRDEVHGQLVRDEVRGGGRTRQAVERLVHLGQAALRDRRP
jgi:hypothetical protein